MITFIYNDEEKSVTYYDGEMIIGKNFPFIDEANALAAAEIKVERLQAIKDSQSVNNS